MLLILLFILDMLLLTQMQRRNLYNKHIYRAKTHPQSHRPMIYVVFTAQKRDRLLNGLINDYLDWDTPQRTTSLPGMWDTHPCSYDWKKHKQERQLAHFKEADIEETMKQSPVCCRAHSNWFLIYFFTIAIRQCFHSAEQKWLWKKNKLPEIKQCMSFQTQCGFASVEGWSVKPGKTEPTLQVSKQKLMQQTAIKSTKSCPLNFSNLAYPLRVIQEKM